MDGQTGGLVELLIFINFTLFCCILSVSYLIRLFADL